MYAHEATPSTFELHVPITVLKFWHMDYLMEIKNIFKKIAILICKKNRKKCLDLGQGLNLCLGLLERI